MPDSGDNAHVYRSVFQGEFEVNSGVYILSFSPPLGGGEFYQVVGVLGKKIKWGRLDKRGREGKL